MLKVYDKKLGELAVLCVEGRIVRGETAWLDSAVASQSDVSAVVIDLTHVSASMPAVWARCCACARRLTQEEST